MQYEQLERESSKYTERIQRLEQLLQERSVRTAAIESEAVSLVQVRYRLTDRQRDSQTVSQTVSQTDRQTDSMTPVSVCSAVFRDGHEWLASLFVSPMPLTSDL